MAAVVVTSARRIAQDERGGPTRSGRPTSCVGPLRRIAILWQGLPATARIATLEPVIALLERYWFRREHRATNLLAPVVTS